MQSSVEGSPESEDRSVQQPQMGCDMPQPGRLAPPGQEQGPLENMN